MSIRRSESLQQGRADGLQITGDRRRVRRGDGAVEAGAGLIRCACDNRQMSNVTPGWYDDPVGEVEACWSDGVAWAEQIGALPTHALLPATPPSPTASDFAGTNPVRLNRSPRALLVGAVSGVFGFVSSLAPGGQLGAAEVIDAALSGALLSVIVYAIAAARSRTPNRR